MVNMNEVKEWLTSLGCLNCQVVQLTIQRGARTIEKLEAVYYEQARQYQPQERAVEHGWGKAGETYYEKRLYLLGQRPKWSKDAIFKVGDNECAAAKFTSNKPFGPSPRWGGFFIYLQSNSSVPIMVKGETMTPDQLKALREELLNAIRLLLPPNQEEPDYNTFVPYCAGIKYLFADGSLSTYSPHNGQLDPMHITDLPVDSLVTLLDSLKKRRCTP